MDVVESSPKRNKVEDATNILLDLTGDGGLYIETAVFDYAGWKEEVGRYAEPGITDYDGLGAFTVEEDHDCLRDMVRTHFKMKTLKKVVAITKNVVKKIRKGNLKRYLSMSDVVVYNKKVYLRPYINNKPAKSIRANMDRFVNLVLSECNTYGPRGPKAQLKMGELLQL